MKLFRTAFFVLFLLSGFHSISQDITGDWNGVLQVQGIQLRLVFHIDENEEGMLISTMDSPDQGATGIPVSSTVFSNDTLTLIMLNLGARYTGVYENGEINGVFNQAGMNMPLDLSREAPEVEVLNRPQEPKEPFPYVTEEVSFTNVKDEVTLAGTLTLPEGTGPFPAVVMITGSGPQNRDEEILGHKPFLVIADHLTRQGIAVLRYDDRGTAGSTGNFQAATGFDLANDVRSAVSFLRGRDDIDSKKIGLVGHSEGGIIAPMVAAGDKKIGFIVLLAGTGTTGAAILLEQQELILRANGFDEENLKILLENNKVLFDFITSAENAEDIREEVYTRIHELLEAEPQLNQSGMSHGQFARNQTDQLLSPWMFEFLKYDPYPSLTKVKCPVLALNGEKDLQVPVRNLELIASALQDGKNKDLTTRAFPDLNHLFQECETGSPNEYREIEQTISPEVLEFMSGWILERIK